MPTKKLKATSGSLGKAEESATAASSSGNDGASQRFSNLSVVLDLLLTYFCISFSFFNHYDILIRNLLPSILSYPLYNSAESGIKGTSDARDENNDQKVHYININRSSFSLDHVGWFMYAYVLIIEILLVLEFHWLVDMMFFFFFVL